MLVGVVGVDVGRFADLHVGQSENWVWDCNGSVAPKQWPLNGQFFYYHSYMWYPCNFKNKCVPDIVRVTSEIWDSKWDHPFTGFIGGTSFQFSWSIWVDWCPNKASFEEFGNTKCQGDQKNWYCIAEMNRIHVFKQPLDKPASPLPDRNCNGLSYALRIIS